MSPPGRRCPGCGSSNIVEDDFHAQAQLVCSDCGAVVSEGSLAEEHVEGSGVNFVHSSTSSKKPCSNQIKGHRRVKAMCQTLRVHSGIENLALAHFKQAYQHESFLHVSCQKKEMLAGCSVLLSCRQLNWPITIGTVSWLVGADVEAVGAIYKEVVKVLDIKATIVGITDVMQGHCHEYKISPDHVPEELAVNLDELTKRAVDLVELAADSWIVTGRRPVPIMMAAVYLSWQSLRPDRHRLKFTLDKFCQIAKVDKHRPAMKRIAEMKSMLCKLCSEIPWLTDAASPETVVLHLGDILKHRFFLLRKALRTKEEDLLRDSEDACEDSVAQTSNTSPPERCAPNAKSEKQAAGHGDVCPAAQSPSDTPNTPGPDLNWGKRMLFAPPCVLTAKRRRAQQPPQPDVTGDEEISDSEIDSYIRTPQEVRDFASGQKKLSEL